MLVKLNNIIRTNENRGQTRTRGMPLGFCEYDEKSNSYILRIAYTIKNHRNRNRVFCEIKITRTRDEYYKTFRRNRYELIRRLDKRALEIIINNE